MNRFFSYFIIAIFLSASSFSAEEKKILSLKDAQTRVLASDQSLRNAFLEIQKSKLLPWSAWTAYTPRVSGSLGYSNTEAAGGADRNDSRTAGITYQQPLLDLAFFPTYELGKLSVEVSQLQQKALERETIYGLAKAYYDVLKKEKLVGLDKEILALTENQLAQVQEKLRVGDVSSLDESRAKLDVANAKNQWIQDESNLILSRNTLRNILNFREEYDFELEEPPLEEVKDEEFNVLLKRAYQQREDYTAAMLAIDQEQEKKNQTLAEYAPKVNGQLQQQWTDNSSQSDSSFGASVSVSVPIFEGGQRELDLKSADYKIEQSRIEREKLEKTIQEEVKNAWVQIRTLRENLIHLSVASETAEQAYRQTQAQYEAGSSTSLDVMSALRDLNQAKTNFTSAKYDYQTAWWDIRRATGDLSKEKMISEKEKKGSS